MSMDKSHCLRAILDKLANYYQPPLPCLHRLTSAFDMGIYDVLVEKANKELSDGNTPNISDTYYKTLSYLFQHLF